MGWWLSRSEPATSTTEPAARTVSTLAMSGVEWMCLQSWVRAVRSVSVDGNREIERVLPALVEQSWRDGIAWAVPLTPDGGPVSWRVGTGASIRDTSGYRTVTLMDELQQVVRTTAAVPVSPWPVAEERVSSSAVTVGATDVVTALRRLEVSISSELQVPAGVLVPQPGVPAVVTESLRADGGLSGRFGLPAQGAPKMGSGCGNRRG